MTTHQGEPVSSSSPQIFGNSESRVFVTGSSGFVGTHLVRALLLDGAAVRTGIRSTLLCSSAEPTKLQQVRFDLMRPETFRLALEGVDTIVHLAALTHSRDASHYHQVNAEGTRRLLVAAREVGVKRFVLASSLAARGPSPCPAGGEKPDSDYGRSKLQAERYVEATRAIPETVIMRLAGIYGPHDRDMLPLFQMASQGYFIVPSRTKLLQPLYIGDAVSALLAAAHHGGGTGLYEVAEPTAYGWDDVLEFFSHAFQRRILPIRVPSEAFTLAGQGAQWVAQWRRVRPSFDVRRARDFAVHTWLTDASAAERALHWTATTPLATGLARTAAWYRQEGWLPA